MSRSCLDLRMNIKSIIGSPARNHNQETLNGIIDRVDKIWWNRWTRIDLCLGMELELEVNEVRHEVIVHIMLLFIIDMAIIWL